MKFIIIVNCICAVLECKPKHQFYFLLPFAVPAQTSLSFSLLCSSPQTFTVMLNKNNTDLSMCHYQWTYREERRKKNEKRKKNPALLGQALAAHNKSIHAGDERHTEREA